MTGLRSACLTAALAAALMPPAAAAPFDATHTAFGFHLRTRWGARVEGRFPRHDGELVRLDDGRRRVRVALDAGAAEIAGSPRWTAVARGPRFFDAQRHPQLRFVSEPFDPALLVHGGPLAGELTVRGVSRTETFELLPSTCARPGQDCDVVAHGSVRRDHYGLDGLPLALQRRVHFSLRARLADAP